MPSVCSFLTYRANLVIVLYFCFQILPPSVSCSLSHFMQSCYWQCLQGPDCHCQDYLQCFPSLGTSLKMLPLPPPPHCPVWKPHIHFSNLAFDFLQARRKELTNLSVFLRLPSLAQAYRGWSQLNNLITTVKYFSEQYSIITGLENNQLHRCCQAQ